MLTSEPHTIGLDKYQPVHIKQFKLSAFCPDKFTCILKHAETFMTYFRFCIVD